jgi:GDP-L-fucose synthase
MINKNSVIFVTGHKGLVGSSVVRRLNFFGYKNILVVEKESLDLRNQAKVDIFFKKNKINAVINAAAKVGGIYANNKYRADFIYDNLSIQNNIISCCYKYRIKSLIFLGSSCIYPRNCKQPIKESYLLTGELEKTNEPYAIAKIAGIKMCESYNLQYKTNYKCLMPCNLYGPNDNYNDLSGHFFPAIIARIHKAKLKNLKELIVWGNGQAKREMMYVDDLADACIYFLNKKTKEILINIGSGIEKKIIDYVKFAIKRIGANVRIKLDKKKPSGTPRKIIDCSLASRYGWESKIDLEKGFALTYEDYLKKIKKNKK